MTHTRAIPFNKFGKRVIFYTKELDEWIKQNAVRVKTREEIEREACEYVFVYSIVYSNKKDSHILFL